MDDKVIQKLQNKLEENNKKIDELEHNYDNNDIWEPKHRYLREYFFTLISFFCIISLMIGIDFFTSIDLYINASNMFIMFFTSYLLGVKIDKELEVIRRNDLDFFKRQIDIEIEKIKLIQRNKVIKKLLNNNKSKDIILDNNKNNELSLEELYKNLDTVITKLVLKKHTPTFDDVIEKSSLYSIIWFIISILCIFVFNYINYDMISFIDLNSIVSACLGGLIIGIGIELNEAKRQKETINDLENEYFTTVKCKKLDRSKQDYRDLMKKYVNEIVLNEYKTLNKENGQDLSINIVNDENKQKRIEQKTTMTKIAPKIVDYEFKGNPEEKKNVKVLKRNWKR